MPIKVLSEEYFHDKKAIKEFDFIEKDTTQKLNYQVIKDSEWHTTHKGSNTLSKNIGENHR